MKVINILVIFVLFFSFTMYAQEDDPELSEPVLETKETDSTELSDLDITLGSIRFPKPFIHSKKDYEPGIYYITLTAKEGIPYFNVYTPSQELLFEEMAVVKSRKAKSGKFKYRLRKRFLNKQEYFNLKVITPGHWIMAFFLVKK